MRTRFFLDSMKSCFLRKTESFFLPPLTHRVSPTQLHAEPGELCLRIYLYRGVGCSAHAPSLRLSDPNLQENADGLTGSACVLTGSVRGDGDHLHGGRAPLQQHLQVQGEGLQRQRSGPVQQDAGHADL